MAVSEAAPVRVPTAVRRELYELMVLSRVFETEAERQYKAAKIGGYCHLSSGQEATCVGVIDAHHGSNIPEFLESLKRIKRDDAEFLLPSHGPVFRRDGKILQKAIDRLTQYQYMADFGTCAIGWPLLDEWEADVCAGRMPFKEAAS